VLLEDKKLGVRQYQVPVQIDNGVDGVENDVAPVVQIISPTEGSLVKGIVEVRGIAGSAELELIVVEVGFGLSPVEWTEVRRLKESAVGTQLALWDSVPSANGIYTIRVTVTDKVFGKALASVYVVVQNEED
jgi:hypothetical protein